MVIIRQIILLSLISNVLFAKPHKDDGAASDGRNKDEIVLRESLGGKQSNVLLLTIIDLVKEVKDLHCLVKEHSVKIELLQYELMKKMEDQNDNMKSKLVGTIEGVESRLVQNIEDMESNVIRNIGELDSMVENVDSKIEAWRSEVRLISQQKLTWQNGTYLNHHSDFVVDGVYTLSKDYLGINPIQHMSGAQVNQMIIIDLGGLFKIHSVKVWNRVDCCQDRLGVVIYADDELLGSIFQAKRIYNFRAKDNVYARRIYLKTVSPTSPNYVEVQVFGTGPYSESELKKLKI